MKVQQNAQSGESFQYTTTSKLGSSGSWTTTGTGSGNACQNSVYTESTNTASYARPSSTGPINGFWRIYDTTQNELNLNSKASLDSSGNWVLTSGNGTSYSGSGRGSGYDGSGDYQLSGSGDASHSWSLSGHIVEHGERDTTAGVGATLSVKNGDWQVASASNFGAFNEMSSFSDNVSSGSFTSGSASGMLTHQESDTFKERQVYQLAAQIDGSGNVTGWSPTAGSGTSGTVDYSHDFTWSYSGSGPASDQGIAGTLTLRGNGGSHAEDHEQLTMSSGSNGVWQATSGTASASDSDNESASFSGQSAYSYSNDWGTISGTKWLTEQQGDVSSDSASYAYSNGNRLQTGGSLYANTYASSHASYSGSGSYTDGYGLARVNGSQSEDGVDDYRNSQTVIGTYLFGKLIKVGFGAYSASGSSQYSYSGSGDYVYGFKPGYNGMDIGNVHLQGTAHESGADNSSYHYNATYLLLGDTWLASGAGGSSESGNWSSDFGGDGSYTVPTLGELRATASGTIEGFASEEGGNYGVYDRHIDKVLDGSGNWTVNSSSGTADEWGGYSFSDAGHGEVEERFFEGPDSQGNYDCFAVGEDFNYSSGTHWSYNNHENSVFVNGDWQGYGAGEANGGSDSHLDYEANARDNGTDFHDESTDSGSSDTSTTFQDGWAYNPAGTYENDAATSTASGQASFDLSNVATGSDTYENAQKDYGFSWGGTAHSYTCSSPTSSQSWSDSTGSASGGGTYDSLFVWKGLSSHTNGDASFGGNWNVVTGADSGTATSNTFSETINDYWSYWWGDSGSNSTTTPYVDTLPPTDGYNRASSFTTPITDLYEHCEPPCSTTEHDGSTAGPGTVSALPAFSPPTQTAASPSWIAVPSGNGAGVGVSPAATLRDFAIMQVATPGSIEQIARYVTPSAAGPAGLIGPSAVDAAFAQAAAEAQQRATYNNNNGDWLDQLSNFSADYGDQLSGGLTRRVRQWAGYDDVVNYRSNAYAAGEAVGTVHSLAIGFFGNPCSLGMKVINGVEAVGNVFNAVDNFKAGNFAAGGLNLLGAAMNASQMFKACFAAGTQVVVGVNADGTYATKNIEDIQAGDYVLSRPQDDPNAPLELKQVTAVYVHQVSQEQLLTITDAEGRAETITCTSVHPFWVEGQGWVAASDLTPGTALTSPDGSPVVVTSNVAQVLTEPVNVYNLEVDGDHTYFVDQGAEPVWVHNSCYKVPKSVRNQAVKDAWKAEADLVRRTNGLGGTRNWLPHQVQELLATGRVKGFFGHHINNVAHSPLFAGLQDNVKFLTWAEHLAAHYGGRFRLPTFGDFLNR